MLKTVRLPVLALLLLGMAACTADKSEDSAAAEQATCRELLGSAGMNWLEERTGGPGKARMKSNIDLKKARSLFYEQVGNWDPDSTGTPSFAEADVCRASMDVNDPGKELAIEYGPSILAFDVPFPDSGKEGKPTVTPVNSDVRLIRRPFDDEVRYFVFIKCKIPGTPAKQENGVPIEGSMSDTLTGDTSARTHFTHLLHSARVVAKSFGCQNKPVVPFEPPASVK